MDKCQKMKLYDDCLIYFLKNNICTDALPSTIQDDIFALKFFYQLTRKCTEKAAILEYCTISHSLWWEDKLENIGTVCFKWDGCVACYRWNEIEEEKKKGDVALQKLTEELSKLRNYVKEAHMKIPIYLSHLTDKITSLCSCYIYKDQIFSLKSSI